MILRTAVLVMMAGSFLTGCGPVSGGSSNNQMMLVRQTPGTLGYRRLMAKSAEIADLKTFIEQTGLPDFLAEANSSDRQYLIFYYLEKHQAFACRTKNRQTGEVEFAGPYPMTAGELRLLNTAKGQANLRPPGG